jgi:tetratricopeptide (TPR) repeat protein/transcriptional regulator with XRE-family HTH domain
MATVSTPTFGSLLRRCRLAAGLTQEELAAQAGLSPRGISDLERGARRAPRRETVHLLAETLHLSPTERSLLEAAARQRGTPHAQALGATAAPAVRDVISPKVVGRAHELALVSHLLSDGPPILLVTGEPGIGKSRLLQAGIEQAEREGWTVLAGGSHRRSGQDPYAPVVGALAASLRRQTRTEQRRNLQDCARLVGLLPELAENGLVPLPTWTLSPQQERRLMFDAVARFLANVSGPTGTLLVLDDLHWASPDALDLLQSLMGSPMGRPVRLLAAYRDTDLKVEDPLALFATDLTRDGRAAHALLAPLEAAAANALLADLLPRAQQGDPDLRHQLLERAGGVPLFLVSCVQALATGRLSWHGATHVPWTLREAILQRVVALPEAAQQVLRLAAVVGRRVPSALLTSAAVHVEMTEDLVVEALARCGRARLLVEQDDDTYQFAHDLIREVLLADLGAARRALLHRRVAEALEHGRGTPPLESLAFHYGQSDEADKGIVYLERTGDAARARYAHAEAAEAYREVVARLDAVGRVVEAAAVREKLGGMLTLLARHDEAIEALEAAAACYAMSGDRESELRTLAQLGLAHRWRGTAHEGLWRLLPVAETLSTVAPTPAGASLYVALTHLYLGTGQHQRQLAMAEAAVAAARSVEDDRLRTEAEGRRGSALLALGRVEEAHRVLSEEVIPLAEAAGDARTWRNNYSNLVRVAICRGEFVQARDYVERALAHTERPGDQEGLAFLAPQRGLLAFLLGEWDRARADFHRAAGLVPSGAPSIYPLGSLGLLSLAEGDDVAAAAQFTRALEVATRHHDLWALRWLQGSLAERDLLVGQPEQARDRLVPLLDLADPEMKGLDVTQLLPLLAWVYLEVEEPRQAENLLTPLVAETRAQHLRLVLCDALRVQGLLRTRQGRWQEAEAALEEALALARAFPHPYGEAKILMYSGVLLLRKRNLEQARQTHEAALVILRRLGERLYARRIEQLLGAAGGDAAGVGH